MPLALFISWRYLLAKRKERFISLISVISVLGIAIGVAALIVVIAVMTGFDRDLREKIVGNYSHISVSDYRGICSRDYPGLAQKISAHPHVQGLSPYVQGQVLFKQADRFFAVGLKGIDTSLEPKVTQIQKYLLFGSLQDLQGDSVIIGNELALYFGLRVGGEALVYSPEGKQRKLKVVGIFKSGMYEYDLNLAFMNLESAQGILGLKDKVTAIAVKLDDIYLADKVKAELTETLGFNYALKTWTEANQNFFAALKLEKLAMFIILTLIVLVASFNIVSTLIVMVVDKTKDIGILKTIGMNASDIRKIFTAQGLLIGILGTSLGASGGLALCALLKKYQFIKLPQDIYYIDRLPVAIEFWPDIVFIIIAAMCITLVSTIYPAGRAAQLKPVEALRYE